MRFLYVFLITSFTSISSMFGQTFEDSVVVSETSYFADSLKFYDFISPNDDGFNDYFVIDYLQYFPNSELMVYNTWGSMVYQNKNYQNEFSGRANVNMVLVGQELPDGVYYYTLIDTIKRKHSGKITIKR